MVRLRYEIITILKNWMDRQATQKYSELRILFVMMQKLDFPSFLYIDKK